jgi:hypothetical protein
MENRPAPRRRSVIRREISIHQAADDGLTVDAALVGHAQSDSCGWLRVHAADNV